MKPFDSDVLLARLRSVLRRSSGRVVGSLVRCGELWANSQSRKAGRGDQQFELTPLEFDLLHFLLRQPGRAWSRDQILQHVWGLHGGMGGIRTVGIHVKRLRSKVEVDSADPLY